MRKSHYVALWVALLLKANHKDNKMIWNGDAITVKEGQFITGRKELNKETGIAESTIEDIMKYLETQHQIRQQKTNKYRLITILNWESYQNPTLKATTKQQQADTNKNVNNEKKYTLKSKIQEEPRINVSNKLKQIREDLIKSKVIK